MFAFKKCSIGSSIFLYIRLLVNACLSGGLAIVPRVLSLKEMNVIGKFNKKAPRKTTKLSAKYTNIDSYRSHLILQG